MKLVTFAVDTPVGEIRRVGAIRKDGFYVDLCAGREALLASRGERQPMSRLSWIDQVTCCPLFRPETTG